jgi:hypothetical protein
MNNSEIILYQNPDGNIKLGGQGPQLSSLRSPNARNEFAFALGDRKLLVTLKFLYLKMSAWKMKRFGLRKSEWLCYLAKAEAP